MKTEEHAKINQAKEVYDREQDVRGQVNCIYLGFAAFLAGTVIAATFIKPKEPCMMQVNPGIMIRNYTMPGTLEMQVEDINGLGLKETVVKYDGREYLLQMGTDEKLHLSDYTPAKKSK